MPSTLTEKIAQAVRDERHRCMALALRAGASPQQLAESCPEMLEDGREPLPSHAEQIAEAVRDERYRCTALALQAGANPTRLAEQHHVRRQTIHNWSSRGGRLLAAEEGTP